MARIWRMHSHHTLLKTSVALLGGLLPSLVCLWATLYFLPPDAQNAFLLLLLMFPCAMIPPMVLAWFDHRLELLACYAASSSVGSIAYMVVTHDELDLEMLGNFLVIAVALWVCGVIGARVSLILSTLCYRIVVGSTEPTCHKCGYLLRGLTEARCPECGTPFDPKQLLAAKELSAEAPFEQKELSAETPIEPKQLACGTLYELKQLSAETPQADEDESDESDRPDEAAGKQED